MVVGEQVCQARAGSKLDVRRALTSCLAALVPTTEFPPTMKLTPELLAQAPSALNPVKERQLDLRGKSAENFMLSSYANCRVRIQNPCNRKPWCDQGSVHDLTRTAY